MLLKKYLTVILAVVFIGIVIVAASLLNSKGGLPTNIHDFGMWKPVIIGLAALVDSVNPCAFSVLFISIAFLFSLERSRSHIILSGLLYILGIFVVYLLIGFGVLKTLNFFNISHGFALLGASIIILAGLIDMIGAFFPTFPIKLKIPSSTHKRIAPFIEKGTFISAFILGSLVGLFEFPCTGGPYLFVLTLLHGSDNYWSGVGYLLIYNIIFVLPLFVILFATANKTVLEGFERWRRAETKKSRVIMDIITIIIGLVVFFL